MTRDERHGWVLLEVLLALVILGIAAASFAIMVHESSAAVERSATHEREVARAERIVYRYVTLDGRELERMVGRWTEDGFGVRLSRLQPSLFEIVLVAHDGRVALETALYRPAHADP